MLSRGARRGFVLACISLVLSFMFAAGTTMAAGKTIIFTEYSTAYNAELRQQQLNMFQAVTGIHVDYQPLEWFPALEKYPVMLAAGSYPDLWMFPPQLWPAFAGSAEVFADLMDFIKDTPYDIKHLPEGQVEAGTVNGRWIGLSSSIGWAGGAELLAFNTEYLSRVGIPDLDLALTWQDFYQIDRKLYQALTKEGIAGSTMGIHGSSAHETIMNAVMRAFGGAYVRNDLTGAAVREKPAVDSFEFIKQFVDLYRESGLEPTWFAFREGTACIAIGSPSGILSDYQGLRLLDMSLGVTLLPIGPRGHRGYIKSPPVDMGPTSPIFPFVIPKSPNQKEAWRLFEFLVFDPRALEVYAGMDVIPTVHYRPNLSAVVTNLGPIARMILPMLMKAEEETVVELLNPIYDIDLEIGSGRTRDFLTEYLMGRVPLSQTLDDLERFINSQLQVYSDRVAQIQAALKKAGLI